MNQHKHPASGTLDLLGGRPPTAPECEALVEIARAGLLLVENADGRTPDQLRALDKGWGDLKRGLAHLAGRKHISEA